MAKTKLTNYLLTETDVVKALSGKLPDIFIKDYISSKSNSTALLQAIEQNVVDIEELQTLVQNNADAIASIDGRLTTAETTISNHVGAQSAHGATGDIVGTDDYCTATVGGTVLLAAAQANAVSSTVAVTSPDAGAAPAAYTQAQMAQVVALVNELKADLTQTVSDLNAAIAVINNMLATERTAKQRAL